MITFPGPVGRVKASGEKEKDKYILRPETAESYFVLWRQSGDPKYRNWGWELVIALEDHCRYFLRPAACHIPGFGGYMITITIRSKWVFKRGRS